MNRIPYIEFARGYAIFTIVCFHVLQRVGLPPMGQKAIVFGGTGVHLFFLISGFGLALSIPDCGLRIADFYKKRLAKVWLPYVLVLTVSLAAALAFSLFPDRWAAWFAGVFLYQMFSETWIESFGGHFWFISTIVQFYLVFPILLFLKKRVGGAAFFCLCLAGSVAWWLTVFFMEMGEMRVWNSFFLQFLWEFGLGMWISDFSIADCGLRIADFKKPESNLSQSAKSHLPATIFGKKTGQTSGWKSINNQQSSIINRQFQLIGSLVLGLFFTALMILMVLKLGPVGKIFNDIPALLGYGLLSVFVFLFSEKWLPPVDRFFRWVGSFGYSLYLVHILVLESWIRLGGFFHFEKNTAWLLAFLPVALLAGWLFEPVSQRWTRLFISSKKPA